MLFLFTMIFGTMISISSFSWMGMWLGLEINLLAIIPLMINNNIFSSEAALKYFIVQALASTIFLFSLIMISSNFILFIDSIMILMLNSSLLMKMGMAPFHFWFPEVMEGLTWMNCLLVLTWQKITPMILIMYNLNFSLFLFFTIMFSILISSIMGINQISLRKILTFSSINHIAWMISSMFYIDMIWFYYFLIYSIISINIILIFYLNNIFFVKQLFSSFNKNFMIKFFFILNFLSLGGLPPFLGFFPKWLTIQNLIENNFIMLTFLMIIFTLLTLFYYMRITFSALMMNSFELNFSFNFINSNFLIFSINMISILGILFSTLIFNYF
uniref:NADH-ubiquinone oxidoreductase chain 2 n=1 Tax=Nudobius lentus TaxID=878161 RepID=A0A0S2M7U6_9COLE|nr:NADH deshydrogenase subunit 2 [Nudobius lentus]